MASSRSLEGAAGGLERGLMYYLQAKQQKEAQARQAQLQDEQQMISIAIQNPELAKGLYGDRLAPVVQNALDLLIQRQQTAAAQKAAAEAEQQQWERSIREKELATDKAKVLQTGLYDMAKLAGYPKKPTSAKDKALAEKYKAEATLLNRYGGGDILSGDTPIKSLSIDAGPVQIGVDTGYISPSEERAVRGEQRTVAEKEAKKQEEQLLKDTERNFSKGTSALTAMLKTGIFDGHEKDYLNALNTLDSQFAATLPENKRKAYITRAVKEHDNMVEMRDKAQKSLDDYIKTETTKKKKPTGGTRAERAKAAAAGDMAEEEAGGPEQVKALTDKWKESHKQLAKYLPKDKDVVEADTEIMNAVFSAMDKGYDYNWFVNQFAQGDLTEEEKRKARMYFENY